MPKLGGYSDTSIITNSQPPNNPFLASNRPLLDPDSDVSNPAFFFKSLAEFRRQESNNYLPKAFGVAFRNLSVYGYKTSTDYQHTFGNYPATLFSKAFGHSKEQVNILNRFDGLVHQGEMLLVLGRPGSGCSTLLKTIAGEMHSLHIGDKSEISYNGVMPESLHREFRGECIYEAELDTHFPELTVRQTLAFAAKARVSKILLPGMTQNRWVDNMTKATLAIFNLSHVAESKIGDDLIRGISGGERKRVSIAEAFIGASPLQCWDNSTRGLDSSTALSFTQLLRHSAHTADITAILTVYQASQTLYNLFDKVTLLYEGHQIYFGPINAAKQFFIDIGFICADPVTTPDFLTSLTNPAERNVREGYELRVPQTPEDFERVWRASAGHAQLVQKIKDTQQKFSNEAEGLLRLRQARDAEKMTGRHSPYTVSILRQITICIVRGFQRLRQNLVFPISGIVGTAIMGAITGSVFYNLRADTSSFYSRGALIFFATMINATSSAFEVLTMWAQRPIVEKHTRYAFYHPSAEAVASMICDLPNKLLTSLFFNLILYFMADLHRSPSAFFTFYSFSLACLLTMSMFFRMVGLLSRTHAQAMAPVAIWILNLIISIGFVLPTREMKPWLRWIGLINPMAYTFESLMINEFHNRQFLCSNLVPTGPGYTNLSNVESICATAGAVPGELYVDGDAYLHSTFGYHSSHLWRNLGIILAFMVLFLSIHILAAEFVSAQRPKGDMLLFRRTRRSNKVSAMDVEKAPPNMESPNMESVTPRDLPNGMINEHRCDAPLGIEKQKSILTWNGLKYDIVVDGEVRRLLDEVDGWVKPGTLTALMGATGTGKTTLLDVLADRVSIGTVTGEILVNGHARIGSFQRETGYVQQADIHIPISTVREALNFSATLRQPKATPLREKLSYVDHVLGALEMESYADAVIGTRGDGLNVEQRKRLSIAVELAAKPALLLFLDEPTSGLDSQTAWSTCKLLRKLANNGQAILCTIHQPSASLFQTFDRLLLLGGGGKPLYFGDIGSDATIMKDYFGRHGARQCREGENPAEWLLDITGAAMGSNSTTDWSATWSNSREKERIKVWLSEIESKQSILQLEQNKKAGEEYAVPFGTQLWAVTGRNFEQDWRVPSYLYSKIVLSTGTAFFIGFSFWMSPTSNQGLQDQIFSIFLLMIIFSNLTQLIIEKFVHSRALFEARERPSKIYSWRVFLFSTIIAELPSQTVIAVLVFFCWYYPIGMFRNAGSHKSERGALMFLLIWSFCLFTSTFSHMIIAGIEQAGTAVNIAQLLYMLSLIFCGVLVRPDNMPTFWSFMNRVSPLTYLIGGMAVAGLADTSVTCAPLELLSIEAPSGQTCGQFLLAYMQNSGGRVLNPEVTGTCQFCPVAKTDDVLVALGFSYAQRWRDFGLMLVYVSFNVAGAYIVYWLARGKRWKRR